MTHRAHGREPIGEAPLSRREFLALAGLLAGGPGALSPAPAGAQTARQAELVIAHGADLSSLDPHFSASVQDTDVSFNLYDTLVSRHWDNRLHPSLATGWRLVAPTTWQFSLRAGVRFHNGDPFTSADVKFSIERTYDPRAKTLMATVFTTVDQIEAIDAHTVHVRTKKPDPLLPARLASFGGQILPRDYVERVGADGLRAKPVGTGPVRFVEWLKGDRVVLEAVADYWGGQIDASRVVFKPIPEVSGRIAALLRQEADIITGLPPDHVDRVARHPATAVVQALFAGLYVLVVDSRRPPLENAKIKQALSLALDRGAIVQGLWRGQGVVPNGPTPRGDSFFDDTLPPLRHDADLARQRLREAGYQGEPVILESTAGHLPNDRAMSEAVVAMWRDVGVNARLEVVEFSVMMQRVREGRQKGVRLAAPASTLGDPDGMMWRLLGPGGSHASWRHPRFDELGSAARFSVDEEFRARAYREMTSLFLEHLPWIPIVQPIESYGIQRRLAWRPYPSRQLEIRTFNLTIHRV